MKRSNWLKPRQIPEIEIPSDEVDFNKSYDDLFYTAKQQDESIDIPIIEPHDVSTTTYRPVDSLGIEDVSYSSIQNAIGAFNIVTIGNNSYNVTGKALVSFEAEDINALSPRNLNLGPGSPVYIGEDINPIGHVVQLVSNIDFNHGTLARQLIVSINNVSIQI